jgi:tetratricopeptide (TPR) repeat protein
MKKKFMVLAGSLLITLFAFSQKATYTEAEVSLMTYPFSEPNPVPVFEHIYPYFRFDGYAARGEMQKHKMVILENEYIKVWITPDIGGKIWGAIEKSTGREFIYFNHAVKFRNIAMRGPWTSGGLEFNFGVIGHTPTCSTPVDYLVRNNPDGSVSCFIGSPDLPSGTRWSVEINLPADKAWFSTRCIWDNPQLTEQSYYHWTNLGLKTAGNLEYAFPGNHYLGHDGKVFSWPIDKDGRRINFYENNNFGGPKSYHVFGNVTDFYGGYWHNDHFGFGHYSQYDEKPGKKIWIWGLSDQGMIWEKLLTDTDGQYTELQSGRLFNQEAAESTYSPFKHRSFAPGTTDEWTEYWFPVVGTGGLNYATKAGSVYLQKNQDKVTLDFCPNEKISGTIEVRNISGTAFKKEISLKPLQTLNEKFDYKGDVKDLSVWLNGEPFYNTDPKKGEIKRPVEMPKDFNWQSAYGHWVLGKELEKQRQYDKAEDEYEKSLSIDRWFVPTLNGLSFINYRKTDYSRTLQYAREALSVDTYDPQANMYYALASIALGDTISAIDGFSIASGQIAERSAAFNGLATIFMQKKQYEKSLQYANKSLLTNELGSEAIQLKILALRKLGNFSEENASLSKLESIDPLNHFIRAERWFIQPSADNENALKHFITNEFPEETWLDMVLWYAGKGCTRDALKLLSIAPESPQLSLLNAYLNHASGNEKAAVSLLDKAIKASPTLVFPSRTEMLKLLEWAGTITPDWKINYYKGLILFNDGDKEKGKECWQSCKNVPDFYPFYIARSKMFEPKDPQAAADVDRALRLAGKDWRTGFFASNFYFEQGDTLKALKLVKDNLKSNPENYIVKLQLSEMLEKTGDYPTSVNLLAKTEVLPNEGSSEGREIWRRANLGNAINLIRKNQYKKALESIDKARQWPENLGVGRPYIVDERKEDYLALTCFKALNNKAKSVETAQKITGFNVEPLEPEKENDLITALVLKQNGNISEADQIMKTLASNFSEQKQLLQWMNAVYAGNLNEAKKASAPEKKETGTISLLKKLLK